jgi:predicted nucleic acid-binding protein
VSESFVVDASVGFAWVYPSQASDVTDQLLSRVESGDVIVVPSLWLLDVANGLLAAQRRKLLTSTERKKALATLAVLPIMVDEASSLAAFLDTSELAVKHALSVYDATYLETALRRQLPLASRDKALRKAAKQCDVTLLD